LGFWEDIEKNLTAKINMQQLKAKEVVFLNPHLQEFFTFSLPKIISAHDEIKTLHISQVLLDAFNKGKLRSKKKLKGVKLSYHDPCYLGRGLRIYDPPREVLSRIHGVTLVEMERNKRNAFCCGARAGDDYFKDFSMKTALERLNEFKKTGANLLITACPYCKESFQRFMPDKEQSMVLDLSVFLVERTE
jgi:heterodisulfide reductase subunit D